MFKKISLLLVFSQFIFSSYLYTQEFEWVELKKNPNADGILNLISYTANNIMAITSSGVFILENDIWVEYSNGLDFPIGNSSHNIIDAKVSDNSITLLSNNRVSRKTNSQVAWEKLLDYDGIIDIEFDNKGTLYLLSKDSLFVYSENKLSTNILSTENNMNINNNSFCIDSENNIFVSKFNSVVYSNDGGLTWTRIWDVPAGKIYCDSNNVLYSIANGIRYSTDKGMSWTYSGLGYEHILTIYFNNGGLIAGGSKGVFLSNDNAISWRLIGSLTEIGKLSESWPYVTALLVASNGYLYAGTANGRIFRTLQPFVTALGNISKSSNSSFKLNQNFPNPFNPKTEITFSLPTSEYVNLKIYDILGREVTTLVDQELDAGQHSTEWRPTNVSSGIYIYSLRAGNKIENKKMQYIK